MAKRRSKSQAPTRDPFMLALSARESAELGLRLISKIRTARDGMSKLLRRMKAWDDLFEGVLPEKDFPWPNCSNTNVPLLQSVVDTFVPHLSTVMFGVSPITLVQVRGADRDLKKRAILVQRFLDVLESETMDLITAGDEILPDALLYGTAIIKLPWREGYRQTWDGALDAPEFAVETNFRGPKPESVDLRHFVVYPLTSRDVQFAELIGDRYRLFVDEIRKRVESGEFDPVAVERLLQSPDNESANSQDDQSDPLDDYEGIDKLDQDQLWFWEVIARYDADGDGIAEDCIFTIESNSGIIVKARRFPYMHGRRYYHKFCPFPRSRRFFGRSLAGILQPTQKNLNAFMNQWLDAHTLAMVKAFKVLNSSELDPDSIPFAPGKAIPVGNMDELQEFTLNPVIPGVDVLQVTKEFGENSSAINDITLGKVSSGNTTKGEAVMANAQGGVRFEDVIRKLEKPFGEIAEQALWLCYQFMTESEIADMLDGTDISREDLIHPWRFVPHGNTGAANKALQRQDATFLYSTLAGNPLVMKDPMHIYRVTQDLLSAYDRDDAESYIGSQEDLEAEVNGDNQRREMAVVGAVAQAIGMDPNALMAVYTQVRDAMEGQSEQGAQSGGRPGSLASSGAGLGPGPGGVGQSDIAGPGVAGIG